MNTKYMVSLIIIIVIAGGTYFFWPSAMVGGGAGHTEMSEEMTEHMEAHNDGKTFMAMGGSIMPEILYSKPSAELRLVNHESYEVQLATSDGTYTTPHAPAKSDTSSVSFIAPATPGRYEYHSSHDATIVGVVVVEE